MKEKRCRSLCPVCKRIKHIVGDGRCEEKQGHEGSHIHSDYPHNSDKIVSHRWKRKNANPNIKSSMEK